VLLVDTAGRMQVGAGLAGSHRTDSLLCSATCQSAAGCGVAALPVAGSVQPPSTIRSCGSPGHLSTPFRLTQHRSNCALLPFGCCRTTSR
jgi:hypothetical protein